MRSFLIFNRLPRLNRKSKMGHIESWISKYTRAFQICKHILANSYGLVDLAIYLVTKDDSRMSVLSTSTWRQDRL
jgi:hypothetical protein